MKHLKPVVPDWDAIKGPAGKSRESDGGKVKLTEDRLERIGWTD